MSFICQQCGLSQPHGMKATRKVVETREKEYPRRAKANRPNPLSERPDQRTDDPGGRGEEIVRELLICETCL